jgi:hypothetical protein
MIDTCARLLVNVQIHLPSFIVGSTYLNLSLPVAFWKDLLKTCLEHAHVVVDDCFLLCWMLLTHDAHQSKVSR